MLEWYVSFEAERQNWEAVPVNPLAGRDVVHEAFRTAAQAGKWEGKPVHWMLLIDRSSAFDWVVARYGGDAWPHSLQGVHSYHANGQTTVYPPVETK